MPLYLTFNMVVLWLGSSVLHTLNVLGCVSCSFWVLHSDGGPLGLVELYIVSVLPMGYMKYQYRVRPRMLLLQPCLHEHLD